MDTQRRVDEVRLLICDIIRYLRSELQTHEYQNTTKDSFEGREEDCKNLLERCEEALGHFSADHHDPPDVTSTPPRDQESSYLDMSAKTAAPSVYVDVRAPNESDEEDCDLKKITKEDCKDVYDVCRVSLQTTKTQTPDDTEAMDCPYAGLPAAHLNIQKSPKQGQLFRLEKRLFFDQSKKYYSGILQDWLLCYSDGITAIRPTFCVNLNGVEIEHYGEGKRRDLCFQITDYEAGKKIIFQATSEVDTKEWIHAIEAAIRGDTVDATKIDSPKRMGGVGNALRKLPTPPVQSKTYRNPDVLTDGIYEEPCSLYVRLSQEQLEPICDDDSLKPPTLPAKRCPKAATRAAPAEYDVPKTTQGSLCFRSSQVEGATESPKDHLARSKSDFQTRVKDVHSKLSNQLSSGPTNSPDRGKSAKKSPQPIAAPSVKAVKIQLFREKSTHHAVEAPLATTTPVKKSFWNRLNKSTSPEKKRLGGPGDKEKEKENLLLPSDNGGALPDPKSPKKGKVNMIINQLEANGHLPIFTKNFERFSAAFADSGEDCNYEPIVTMGKY